MRASFSTLFLLIAVLILSSFGKTGESSSLVKDPMIIENSTFQFIENKGQWDAEVLYRLQTPFANMNLEKDQIKFQLLDPESLAALKHQGHNHEAKPGHEGDDPQPQIATHGIKGHNFTMKFVNSSKHTVGQASKPLEQYYNYLIGNDPSKWASHVHLYNEVAYQSLYEGIDLRFYESNGNLKYDYIVSAKADPNLIQVQYDHVDKIFLQDGDLHIMTSVSEVIEKAPYAYQNHERNQTIVECQFVLVGNKLSIKVTGDYDKDQPLIIDPELVFGSYTGAFSDNWGFTATFDNESNAYGGGIAFGDYPTTPGAFQLDNGGGSCDMSISKFSADGSSLIYSTYMGGQSADAPESMIVNENGQLIILGVTGSEDYPMTANSHDNSFNGGVYESISILDFENGTDAVIAILSPDGSSLMGASFIGGSGRDAVNRTGTLGANYGDDFRGEVGLDSEGNIYFVSSTTSTDFPVTAGAVDETSGGGFNQDAVVVKMNSDASDLLWATYLGDSGDQAGVSIRVDAGDNVYVSGWTTSDDFPTTSGALNPNYLGGAADAFVSHITADGSTLLHSTFLGTADEDLGYLLTLDEDGNVYLLGQSEEGNYPITTDVYNNPGSANFIQKMDLGLSTSIWSTQVGNGTTTKLVSTAFLVDVCGRIYLSAWGGATNGDFPGIQEFPVSDDAFQSSTDGSDFYLMVLEPDATGLEYASYFGGSTSAEHVDGGTSRFDKRGIVYQAVCAGCGGNSDFPTTPGVVSQTNNSSNCNLGLFKFDFQLAALDVEANVNMPNGCAGEPFEFENLTIGADNYFWDFGDESTSEEENPIHFYDEPDAYEVTLVATSEMGCISSDSISLIIVVDGVECGTLTAGEDIVTDATMPTVPLDASFEGCGDFTWFGGNGEFTPDRLDPLADYTLTDDEIASGCVFLFAVVSGGGEVCLDTVKITIFKEEGDTLLWDLNACKASPGATKDYSEFEATPIEGLSCGTVDASIVYRVEPSHNRHSCTAGVDDSPAMCISSMDACEYAAGSEKAARFDVTLNPTEGQALRIAGLSFYEKAPEEFLWLGGTSGPNDYPTLYAIRILKDGVVIYEETDIPTSLDWTLEEFDFAGEADFKANDIATYSFELSPYCTGGVYSIVINAWDLDEIALDIRCALPGIQNDENENDLASTSDRSEITSGTNAYLFQNSPNPFSDVTYFSFRLEEETEASFSIHSMDGQVLYEKNGLFAKGHHSIRMNKSELSLSDGVFIYRLTGKDFSLSAKGIMLK